MSLKVLSRLDALFRQYRPAVVHTHLLALNYAYPLMIRYRTPARVYTVHNLAEKDIGLRTAPMVRALAFRYRIGGVVPVAIADSHANRQPAGPPLPRSYAACAGETGEECWAAMHSPHAGNRPVCAHRSARKVAWSIACCNC
jgi:hypothetical protein